MGEFQKGHLGYGLGAFIFFNFKILPPKFMKSNSSPASIFQNFNQTPRVDNLIPFWLEIFHLALKFPNLQIDLKYFNFFFCT